MKYYLIALLLLIMAAGGRTMFQIAYYGATKEHDFGPDQETSSLIFLAIWFMAMMAADVLLLSYKQLPKRNFFIVLLSIGVFVPVIYKLFVK